MVCRARQLLLQECIGAGRVSAWPGVSGACCYPCCQKRWCFSSVGARNSLGRIRVTQKISGLLEMWRTSCSDLFWGRAEETRGDGRIRSTASLWAEETVRTALGRQAMAPVFSGDVKQFAVGLVDLILSRQGSLYFLVVSGLGSIML